MRKKLLVVGGNDIKSAIQGLLSHTTVFARPFKKMSTVFRNNNSVLKDCTHINVNRIFYLSAVSSFMRVIDIIAFAGSEATSEVWGKGIITSHIILLLFYLSIFFITARLRKCHR